MIFNTYGKIGDKIIVLLAGSFCTGKSMSYLSDLLKENYYLIVPEYNGHFENSTFSTRKAEASEIVDYIKQQDISSIDMIYGQSMGAEIGIELLFQLQANSIHVKNSFFDGAPCIKLSYLYKKFMYLKFKTLIDMLKGKDIEEVMNWKFLNKFSNGDTESLRPLIAPIIEIAPFISNATIRNENECCYTFDFPKITEEVQKNIYFFYAKEEKAYRTCIKGVRNAYPEANYEIVEGYGHMTYSVKHTDDYVDKLSEIIERT